MYLESYALIKNLFSSASELNFSDCILKNIQIGDVDTLRRARELFPGNSACYGDWIYERRYLNCEQEKRILCDTEDMLLLLRLYRAGDLVFLQPCIKEPDGRLRMQLPCPVMSYISPRHRFKMEPDECNHFDEFASDLSSRENWASFWFKTARRFFLLGGSTEFNPRLAYFDRVVAYMIAMESALVPERKFVGRRLRERVGSLLHVHDSDQNNETKKIIKKFYDIRSTVVHGADFSSKSIDDSLRYADDFEEIVRKIFVETLLRTPTDRACRKTFLEGLFDVCDQTRVDKIDQDFCAIKDRHEKNNCLDRLVKRIAKYSST